METASAVILALAGIIGALLKIYTGRQPQRDEVKRDKEIDTGRKAILEGDADVVSSRIDSLLRDEPDNSAGRSKDG